ncbi:MAG: nucleotidyltransferase [Lachnospiraceae bacterium]|nr:nucleotidyltransferase [Lachnospiraceae bacterium]
MKTVGLITEYNPFHNGHLYHMQKAKELTGAKYVVVVMSGNFVQRGTPAITDKFIRADMALSQGADLVLELPAVYATGSAEYFSLGAVALLEKLGCIDFLCFGSECGNIEILQKIASFLQEESLTYQTVLKAQLQKGLSYPSARMHALTATFPTSSNSKDLHKTLTAPNNILALEYLKALKTLNSSIIPYTIRRIGADYNASVLNHQFSSATAIRNSLSETPEAITDLITQIPSKAYEILQHTLTVNHPVKNDEFSEFLYYSLLRNKESLETYLDVDHDLAERISNLLPSYTSFTAFADLLKNKAYTHTRITRALCHIMLGITKEDSKEFLDNGIIYYARPLGFRRDASALLKSIKEKSSIPFLTKPSAAYTQLSKTAYKMFTLDLFASDIYHGIYRKSGKIYNEYAKSLIYK